MAGWQHDEMKGNAVVNDRTPQSLLNSSSLIWVNPHTALTGPDLAAPAPGAQRARALQIGGVFAGRESTISGPSSHRRGYRDTDATRVLSVEALFKHHQLHLVQLNRLLLKIWSVQIRTDIFA